MKRENIFDAFEYADPVMVHMAEHRTFPRHTWQKGLAAAAVLMLLVGTGLWTIHRLSVPQPVPPPVTEEPTEPPIKEPETTPIEPTPEEPSMPSDQELLDLVVKLEQGVTDFTFETPLDLSSEQLFDAYLLLAEPGDKGDGFDKDQKDYVFAEAPVELVLGRYFKKFSFDAAEVPGFDAERGGIVRPDDQGVGGDLIGEVTEKSLDGTLLQFTVLYSREGGTPERCKRYEMEWFPGGYYYLSAKEQAVALTQEQIDQVNEAFKNNISDAEGNDRGNPINCFVTSQYDMAYRIAFAPMMRCFPGSTEVEDEAEFQALRQTFEFQRLFPESPSSLAEFELPIHKYPKAHVNEVLMQYIGLTTLDLLGRDSIDVCYLEDQDSFYNFTSDYDPGRFFCERGERKGDQVRLFSRDSLLVLEQVEGRWLIRSHTSTESGTVQVEGLGPSSLETRTSGVYRAYLMSPEATVTVYDPEQLYSQSEDHLYTFETPAAFLLAEPREESWMNGPYDLTVENGMVVQMTQVRENTSED